MAIAPLKTLAFAIGLGIALVGVIGALVPAELVWIARHSTSSRVFIVAGAIRIVFGGLLISVSPASRAPQKLRYLGYIILLAGIGTIVTGLSDMERASDIIDWWTQQDPGIIRLTSLVLVALGGFVAWACAPARATDTRLIAIKVLHTVVWAFFASCVVLIPAAALMGRLNVAAVLCAIVSVEVIVLAVNAWRCPLTGVAARYTPERQPNFDIYLPQWLARYNKEIFGPLFVAGLLTTGVVWFRQDAPPVFVFEARLGLARWHENRGCLAAFTPSVAPQTQIALVEHPPMTDATRVTEARVIGPSQACDPGLSFSNSNGLSPSFYQVGIADGAAPPAGILLALIDPPTRIVVRNGRAEIDLDEDGAVESFRVCTSAENVHFMAWTGDPPHGRPRWHGSYYVGYDMTPSCTDQDVAGMVALEKPGRSAR